MGHRKRKAEAWRALHGVRFLRRLTTFVLFLSQAALAGFYPSTSRTSARTGDLGGCVLGGGLHYQQEASALRGSRALAVRRLRQTVRALEVEALQTHPASVGEFWHASKLKITFSQLRHTARQDDTVAVGFVASGLVTARSGKCSPSSRLFFFPSALPEYDAVLIEIQLKLNPRCITVFSIVTFTRSARWKAGNTESNAWTLVQWRDCAAVQPTLKISAWIRRFHATTSLSALRMSVSLREAPSGRSVNMQTRFLVPWPKKTTQYACELVSFEPTRPLHSFARVRRVGSWLKMQVVSLAGSGPLECECTWPFPSS